MLGGSGEGWMGLTREALRGEKFLKRYEDKERDLLESGRQLLTNRK